MENYNNKLFPKKILFKNFESSNWVERDCTTAKIMLGEEGVNLEERLLSGEVISFPFGLIKMEGVEVCPICNKGFAGDNYSISRRDNNTKICDNCGIREAFIDLNELEGEKNKVKIKMFNSHFAWIDNVLLAKLDRILDSTDLNRTNWIKHKAQEDFGVHLNSKEDLVALDMYVKANHYLDKSDWLREKIRLTIREYIG